MGKKIISQSLREALGCCLLKLDMLISFLEEQDTTKEAGQIGNCARGLLEGAYNKLDEIGFAVEDLLGIINLQLEPGSDRILGIRFKSSDMLNAALQKKGIHDGIHIRVLPEGGLEKPDEKLLYSKSTQEEIDAGDCEGFELRLIQGEIRDLREGLNRKTLKYSRAISELENLAQTFHKPVAVKKAKEGTEKKRTSVDLCDGRISSGGSFCEELGCPPST